jgi:hypothetical protein
MNETILTCRQELRREDVRAADHLFGLDYVEVASENQRTLHVFFLGKAPRHLERANVALSGGRRIRDVKITSIRVRTQPAGLDDYLEVQVDKAGDFSEYTISVVKIVDGHPTSHPMEGFDPRYAQVSFSFKSGCPSDLDCKPQCSCPPPQRTQPDINYLAKDYASFRQLILDRLALIMPEWNETHAPDLGITLVELLAYAGDYLSYYQDAVATEAYLGTARERISVRRHARLVDYFMHEGCNARAWLAIDASSDWPGPNELPQDPKQIFFITPYPGAPDRRVLTEADLASVPASAYESFEARHWNGGGAGIRVYQLHNKIDFYTWGDCECCLPIGATSATLRDECDQTSTHPAELARDHWPRRLKLKAGDVLIFEEVRGPKTGSSSDADPTHRQAVRLTKVTRGIDPLYDRPNGGVAVLEIEWASEDALKFPLCISARKPYPDCGCMEGVSVAHGNVILVDNGLDTDEVLGVVPSGPVLSECPQCCQPAGVTISPGSFSWSLSQKPLTFTVPLPPPCSAADFLQQDPREALPWIYLTSIPPAPACPTPDAAEPQPPCAIPPLFTFDDIISPLPLANALHQNSDPRLQFLLAQLSSGARKLFNDWKSSNAMPGDLPAALVSDLKSMLQTWLPKGDLLESGPEDKHFVVENDNDGISHLRFGDGVCGFKPEAGSLFRAYYRIGNATAGNVGRDTITYIVLRQAAGSGSTLQARNPMAAVGGTDPEPIADVKQFAPYAFRDQLERAITAGDYGSIAGDNQRRLESRAALEVGVPEICASSFKRLQRAKGDLRWTGSWYTVMVALDPEGQEGVDRELMKEVTFYLEPFRRMGCDLLVKSAQYVPLKLSITVCVLPNFLRGHVEAAVNDALGNRVLPNGTLGFFHPDNLTFGGGIYVSRLLAAVQAIPGVQNAMVTELERYEIGEPAIDVPGEELPINSALLLGPFEIARLDNDPNFPENGVLVLDMRGGR